MKRVLSPQEEEMLGMDRYCAGELEFLKVHAENTAIETVHSQVLAMLPSSENYIGFTYQGSARKIGTIRSSRVAIACNETLDKDLCKIEAMLDKMHMGAGPTARTYNQMSDFWKTVMNRAEHFLSIQADKGSEHKAMAGRSAIEHLWKEFQKLPEESRSVESIRPFQTFAWLLNDEQVTEVDKINIDAMRRHTASMLTFTAVCDKPSIADGSIDGGVVASRPVDYGGASSSTGKGAIVLAAPIVAPVFRTDKELQAADAMQLQKAKMLSMFKK